MSDVGRSGDLPRRGDARGDVDVVYAGFWSRTWALVLDVIFVLLVVSLIATLTGGSKVGAISALFIAVYTVGLAVEGGTVGKRVLGLRIVRVDGVPLTVGRALVRELVGRPLSLIAAGLGFLWMLDDPQRQTWHDKLAGSVVVRELRIDPAPVWRRDPPWKRR